MQPETKYAASIWLANCTAFLLTLMSVTATRGPFEMHFFSASVSKSESKFSFGKVWFCSHQLMETHLAAPLLFIVSALLFVAGQVVDYNFFFCALLLWGWGAE